MPLVACKECGKDISSRANSCPHCGISLKKPSILWKVVALPLVIIFLVLIVVGMFMPDEPYQQTDARMAIKACWDQQAKKSNDSAMARFIAGACEKLEQDYEATYRRKP